MSEVLPATQGLVPPPRVSVFIRTMCEARRASSLRAAIQSVFSQQGVSLELIIVLNGSRYDHALVEELRTDSRLKLVSITEADVAKALQLGRSLVRGEFFASLDDDDLYLPGALQCRVAALDQDPAIDFVVTNGLVERGGQYVPFVPDAAVLRADPVGHCLSATWLASCGGLFRSLAIEQSLFEGAIKYYEWTWLTMRILAAGKRFLFLDELTFQVNDTEESLSKKRDVDVMQHQVRLLAEMSERFPPQTASKIREKQRLALHELAEAHLRQGQRALAWRAHAQSLFGRGGWRHITFTRRLLLP